MESVCHSEIFISVAFTCDNCQWNHWLTPVQYSYPDYKVVCNCGNVFRPTPPQNLGGKIGNIGKDVQVSETEISDDNLTEFEMTKTAAIQILKTQGFSNNEIQSAIVKSGAAKASDIKIDIAELIEKIVKDI